jgi:predicted DNA-binding transcriptional regulator AlpA
MINAKEDMIYAKEVGKMLNKHEQTINKYREQGDELPPCYHLGGRYTWRRGDIEAFIDCRYNMEEYNKRVLTK